MPDSVDWMSKAQEAVVKSLYIWGWIILGAFVLAVIGQIFALSQFGDPMLRIATATLINVFIGIVLGSATICLGIQTTLLGVTASYELSVKAQQVGGASATSSIASASPGILFVIVGAVILSLCIWKPIEYVERGRNQDSQASINEDKRATRQDDLPVSELPDASKSEASAKTPPPRQRFRELPKNEILREWQFEWSFQPDPLKTDFQSHLIIVPFDDPTHCYYFDTSLRKFYGRYDSRLNGYSLLRDQDRGPSLDSIKNLFPPPSIMPSVPGAIDHMQMLAPPPTEEINRAIEDLKSRGISRP